MNNELKDVSFDLSKGLSMICIAPDHCTFINMLHWSSLKFFLSLIMILSKQTFG